MTDIVIASAARTPVGAFNGGLASLPASRLGQYAITAALERAGVAPAEVSEVRLFHESELPTDFSHGMQDIVHNALSKYVVWE